MKKLSTSFYIGAAATACIGCCALPLTGLLIGALGLGSLYTLSTDVIQELIVCSLPLILLTLVIWRSTRKKNGQTCSISPADTCQCAQHHSQNCIDENYRPKKN